MPSGGDTGSMPSSLLPRTDLLGSGDLMEIAPQMRVKFFPTEGTAYCHSRDLRVSQ